MVRVIVSVGPPAANGTIEWDRPRRIDLRRGSAKAPH
jgi:hypothetical protein